MEDLFEVFEWDTMKIVLSNDKVHHNRLKFERLLAKAIYNYNEKLRIRKSAAKRRAYKHYDWSLPAERSYPTDTFSECPEMTDHALIPFMQFQSASHPEITFARFLEDNANAIDWWYKNGDQGKAHYAIGYTKSDGEKGLFYVDFIIRMKNGEIFLFDTKKGLIDPDVVQKHNALIDYINREDNKLRKIRGGVIVEDKFGNWVYSPLHIQSASELDNPLNWDIFDPQKYS